MIKNLFKTAGRHILKHPGYSVLNILGLTLGIASALFLVIYVSDELSYDRYNEKADRIFRVSSSIREPDDKFTWIVAQIPFAPQAAHDYAEIQSYVRFFNMPRALYKYEDKEFNEESFYYADSTLFDIFTYKVIKGDVKSALTAPKKIVLTEKIANRYFGKTDPIGKSLKTGNDSYEVAAVIKDIPANSHFRFDAVAARNNLPKQMGSWGNFGVYTYLLLPEGINVKAFEKKIQGMFDNYMKPIFGPLNITVNYNLEPIRKIHLYSTNANEPEPTGSITYVYIFSIVAVFLILIATMNYMNLATARSAKRAREVGLRKVSGSNRKPLIIQFLAESVVLTLISLVLSIILIITLLHSFNNLAGKSFDLSILLSPPLILSVVAITVITGILGGSYPAFFLSRFNPVTIIKGEMVKGSAGSLFRKILVVIQFTVSVTMIICTMTVFHQLNYLKNMDQGFDKNNVIGLQLNGPMVAKYKVLKEELLGNPNIKFVTSTDTPVGEGSAKIIFNVETDQGMVQKGINFAVIDYDFVRTLGITIVKGRDFQKDMPSDTLKGVIVNETFVKRMGWKDPVGKKIEAGDANTLRAKVIGVMKDYHQTGMYNGIESLLLAYRPQQNNIIYIKLSGNETQPTLGFIEKKWKEIFPGEPFAYRYLTDRFNQQFNADEKRGLIFTLFTILAIAIACLGLFGLASYMVEQRTREVGIRKVFGAGESSIVQLIAKDFLILVFIGIIVAIPLSYYFMSIWLEKYVYRTGIGAPLLIGSALITILITFITISYKAYQAATMNPAVAVKTE